MWIHATLLLLALALPARAAADLTVRDAAGGRHRPLADAGQKATVLFFVMHDCPVANSYAPEINRIVAEYATNGVRAFIVYVERELTPRRVRAHAKDFGFKAPALLDTRHELVQAVGATVSPEAAVVSPAGAVLYCGRIDDRVADFGKRRVEPTRRDLRLALDAVLTGKPVPERRTKAIGCYIPIDETPPKPAKNSR